jgi:hypothetical protein
LYVTLHDTYYWPNMHCHTSKLFSQDWQAFYAYFTIGHLFG